MSLPTQEATMDSPDAWYYRLNPYGERTWFGVALRLHQGCELDSWVCPHMHRTHRAALECAERYCDEQNAKLKEG